MGVGGLPGPFTPGKDPVPILQEAGWALGRVWTGAENLAPHRDSIPGLCNISFKEHLPEDGHNRWPKHVGGYADYNTVNLLILVCTCWSAFP